MRRIVALFPWVGSTALLAACGLGTPAASFDLTITPASLYATRGGTSVLLVEVQRPEGLPGEIVLDLEDAPQGIAAEGVVPAGADVGELAVTIDRDASLGFERLRIVGAGVSDRQLVVAGRAEVLLTVLDQALPTAFLVAAEGEGLPAVVYEEAVAPDDGEPYLLQLVAIGGSVVLAEDGRYQHGLTLDTTKDGRLVGRTRWSDRGAWAETEGVVAFTSELVENHAFEGVWSGGVLTVAFDLHPFAGAHATAELAFRE